MYVHGNNAVQLDHNYTTYKTSREHSDTDPLKEHRTTSLTRNQVNRKRRIRQKSSPVYTTTLALVIIATLFITVLLLKTQFTVAENSSKIIALRQELANVKKINGQLESDISKNVKMDEVYDIAVNEFGMVYPNDEEVNTIQGDYSTYTVQYADVHVPDESDGITIGSVLGFISEGW